MALILQIILFFSAFSCGKSAEEEVIDKTPVPVKYGDPFILEHNGTYYM